MRASIVIATRNRAEQLRAGLASIRARAYEDVEIILVDDGSTDDTPAVLQEFQDLFTEIIRLPERSGGYRWNPSYVLNAAHRLATADVVIEQGGEVCHLNDCVTPLLQECAPGRVALARCYHGAPADMEKVRIALESGSYVPPPTERPARCQTEAGHWASPLVEPGGVHLYTGKERLAPFMFLGAIARADLAAIGGYNEARRDRNDTDLADRLQARGVRFSFVGSAMAFHLQHGKS